MKQLGGSGPLALVGSDDQEVTHMKLICAWCLKEGKAALMAETEPLEDQSETHGICPDHRLEIEARVARYRAEAERQREEAQDLREKVDP